MATLLLRVGLLTGSLALTAGVGEKVVTTQDSDDVNTTSLPLEDFVREKERPSGLYAHINCTESSFSFTTVTKDGGILLMFSASEGRRAAHMTSLICKAHMASQPAYVISAVLSEHSPCGGGIFALLWDNTTRTSWDICSAWHALGPDFLTSSNVIDISVELADVTYPCSFSISVRPTLNISKGELELIYLSSTEGIVVWFGLSSVYRPGGLVVKVCALTAADLSSISAFPVGTASLA